MPLYALGSNGSGQLGIGHLEDVSVPTPCLFSGPDASSDSHSGSGPTSDDEILRIVAGGNHTLVLFRSGAVYAAGCDEDGRCGGAAEGEGDGSLLRFERVVVVVEDDDGRKVEDDDGRKVERFKDVAATWEGTVLVSAEMDEEEVFVMGSGSKGELGLGLGTTRAVRPVRIPQFPPRGSKIVSVSSTVGHTVVVLSNGDVYGWGAARKGQLGESLKERKIVWSPVKVEGIPFRATGVACGREFTIVTGSKESGDFAILGSSGPDRWRILSDAPAARDIAGYSLVAASWNGIYVHANDKSVRAWGRNDKGQLPPPDLPRPSKIAVGSEHALALLDDQQKVVAFGWGEHGNCGPETDAQGNVKGRWNEIPLALADGARVVGLGAGCATSWIIVS